MNHKILQIKKMKGFMILYLNQLQKIMKNNNYLNNKEKKVNQ